MSGRSILPDQPPFSRDVQPPWDIQSVAEDASHEHSPPLQKRTRTTMDIATSPIQGDGTLADLSFQPFSPGTFSLSTTDIQGHGHVVPSPFPHDIAHADDVTIDGSIVSRSRGVQVQAATPTQAHVHSQFDGLSHAEHRRRSRARRRARASKETNPALHTATAVAIPVAATIAANNRLFAWECKFDLLRKWIAKEGHANVPRSLDTKQFPRLGPWVHRQRSVGEHCFGVHVQEGCIVDVTALSTYVCVVSVWATLSPLGLPLRRSAPSW